MRGLVIMAFGLILLYSISFPITGYVTSQTCCTGDACTPDNSCNQAVSASDASVLGFFVVSSLTALAVVGWVERR